MSQDQGGNDNAFNPFLQQFLQAGQAMAQQFMGLMSQMAPGGAAPLPMPPVQIKGAPDPEALRELQQKFVDQQARLWSAMLARGQGKSPDFSIEPEPGDRRFNAPEWRESPVFDFMRQSYLLNAQYIKEMVELLPTDEEKAKERLRFLARQYVDALAPSNFAATNPEFIKLAVETKGRSITDGINNLIADLEKGRISMTDETVFEVGGNLATMAGSVIYENELMQLIEYAPLTPRVAKRPLLVVPPCINKFYIMDLQPENSLIRFMVEQGHTVFLISWRNPGEEQGQLTWDDYLTHGPIRALSIVREICRVDQVNTLGFCIGGTLLASALAVLAARGENPAASLTLLTTLLDFSDTGEIGLFIDEQMLAAREASIGQGGLLQARELQSTFSALRPNDLIWNYVANNYLKGQKPQAFDLLYWNSDSTGMPGPFACWYMRNLYLDNSLRVANKLKMCGESVDLGKLEMPAYLLAAREDHIVPWQSAYLSTQLLRGPTRFVLGASGHIAGVINPVSKNKRSFWINDTAPTDPAAWLGEANEQKGSWWSDWAAWVQTHAGGEKPARKKRGNAKYREIEAAPGRYVKERVV
jgi:polyhydroxyalkanoate synthase subunit PhaC